MGEPGPNLTMLDHDSDSDSYSSRRPEDLPAGDDDGDDGFEAGSAIDQLLWRQKAVSGMGTRRPGESVQQFFQRRMAGMRMLKAEAGSSEAKNLETEVDMAIMNASTVWHWGQGDHDADFYDREEQNTENLALEGASDLFEPPYELEGGDAMDDGKLRLLSNSSTSSHLALYGAGGGSAQLGRGLARQWPRSRLRRPGRKPSEKSSGRRRCVSQLCLCLVRLRTVSQTRSYILSIRDVASLS